jgi:predicted acetyltransferase
LRNTLTERIRVAAGPCPACHHDKTRRAATEHIEVIPAKPKDEPILANLLELYAHDFSEFHDIDLGADGRFGYKHLPLYWSEPDRHPFLVLVDCKLAGFVFVKKGSAVSVNEAVWDMAEFFVARKYRRRGIGTEIAHEVWMRFAGPWEVRVMESNRSALHFWHRAISTFRAEAVNSVRIEIDGEYWHVFAFESKGSPVA